ncbi:MAG: type III pantothenate kinase [Oxalobacter sp.]|nr:MAG: type III pantothenate kinase [Oxalobacter sp.]
MLLLVDVGNTMLKWALAENAEAALGQWQERGAAAHKDIEHLRDVLRGRNISRAIVSNVAGKAIRERLQHLLRAVQAKPFELEWFASVEALGGIRNSYRNPAQLGCDRFAAMVGAHALFPKENLIVTCCGTATTVDAVSADGLFIGGMILPGLGLMASSLARSTAHLPQVAQHSLSFNPFASSTNDAITSGCIAAQIGGIEHAVGLHAKRSGQVLCVLSGGAAKAIAPHLSVSHQIVDNLVLIGLHAVAMTPSS